MPAPSAPADVAPPAPKYDSTAAADAAGAGDDHLAGAIAASSHEERENGDAGDPAAAVFRPDAGVGGAGAGGGDMDRVGRVAAGGVQESELGSVCSRGAIAGDSSFEAFPPGTAGANGLVSAGGMMFDGAGIGGDHLAIPTDGSTLEVSGPLCCGSRVCTTAVFFLLFLFVFLLVRC